MKKAPQLRWVVLLILLLAFSLGPDGGCGCDGNQDTDSADGGVAGNETGIAATLDSPDGSCADGQALSANVGVKQAQCTDTVADVRARTNPFSSFSPFATVEFVFELKRDLDPGEQVDATATGTVRFNCFNDGIDLLLCLFRFGHNAQSFGDAGLAAATTSLSGTVTPPGSPPMPVAPDQPVVLAQPNNAPLGVELELLIDVSFGITGPAAAGLFVHYVPVEGTIATDSCDADEQCPLGSCQNGTCASEGSCASSFDCNGYGEVCVSGACQTPALENSCETNADCFRGTRCIGGVGVAVACRECISDADCGSERFCVSSSCAAGFGSCIDDTDCPSLDYFCDPDRNICLGCNESQPAPPGQSCIGGRPGCAGHGDCGEGFACSDGSCVPALPGGGCAGDFDCGSGESCCDPSAAAVRDGLAPYCAPECEALCVEDADCRDPFELCFGSVCRRVAPVCGDGHLTRTEECDDGNPDASDGCDSGCEIEPGFACTGSPSDCN